MRRLLRAGCLALMVMTGCGRSGTAAVGAIRVHGVPGQGELYLDLIARGPISGERVFDGLAPGPHVLELRQRDRVVASSVVKVRAGMILVMRLEAPANVASPVPVRRDPVDEEPHLDLPEEPAVAIASTPAVAPASVVEAADSARPTPSREPAARLRAGPATPRVRPAEVSIRGALSREQVRRVVRRGAAQLRQCYELELLEHPGMAGRVVLEITIAETGTVRRAWVSSTTLPRSGVEACMADVAERWRFAAPSDGGVAVVDQSLVLARTSGPSY